MIKFDPRLSKKEAANERKKSKRLALKLYCIARKGYSCEICGKKHNAYSMSFHHTGDITKDAEITNLIHKMRDKKIINEDFEILHDELDKTILVCEVCHQKLHEYENYTADTYHNALYILGKINNFKLTKDFKFDNNMFKEMYEDKDYEQNSESDKSSGDKKPTRKLLKKKVEVNKIRR